LILSLGSRTVLENEIMERYSKVNTLFRNLKYVVILGKVLVHVEVEYECEWLHGREVTTRKRISRSRMTTRISTIALSIYDTLAVLFWILGSHG
jgi:hypothetical protein